VARLAPLDRLPVIAFDRDCARLLSSASPLIAYWRLPSEPGNDIGDIILDELGGERKGQGYCVILLQSQCAPRHPAIDLSDRLASEQGRLEQDEVWFVQLLRADVLERMQMEDESSRQLGRLLLDGVPRRDLDIVVPQLIVPDYLSRSDTSPASKRYLPLSPLSQSPERTRKIARAREFMSAYEAASRLL
jgi:hypothetical protein